MLPSFLRFLQLNPRLDAGVCVWSVSGDCYGRSLRFRERSGEFNRM